MRSYDGRRWALATCLSALAGYLDAIGFIKLGGFFVSFMSGNSTRLAVSAIAHSPRAFIAAYLIGLFLTGVAGGAVVSALAGTERKVAVLGLTSILLLGAAGWNTFKFNAASVSLVTLAMGVMNNVFQRDGEVSVGITYMTGTLVKIGQHAAAAMLGDKSKAWIPYLLLWTGMLLGALAGASLYPAATITSVWLAAIFACVATVMVARSEHLRPAPAD